MKAIVLSILLCFLWINLTAQAPESFKYQTVVRNSSGEILVRKLVKFRMSILQGTTIGAVVYSELHSRTTNDFGLVDLEIGKGTSPSGTLSGINWGGDSYFLKVEMDPTGGKSFQLMGTSQLLSVPYALFAKNVGKDSGFLISCVGNGEN